MRLGAELERLVGRKSPTRRRPCLSRHIGKRLVLIAESNLNNPRIVRPPERDGFGFYAQWNDDFHHAVHTALTEELKDIACDFGGLDDLACVIRRPYLYEGRFSPHRLRSHGRPAEGVHALSFIAYSLNHEQVGNRATGERNGRLLAPLSMSVVEFFASRTSTLFDEDGPTLLVEREETIFANNLELNERELSLPIEISSASDIRILKDRAILPTQSLAFL